MRFVNVRSPGPTGWGMVLTDVETGKEIGGVRRIVARMEIDDINIIEAEIHVEQVDINGALKPFLTDPESGDLREVHRIIWADGQAWSNSPPADMVVPVDILDMDQRIVLGVKLCRSREVKVRYWIGMQLLKLAAFAMNVEMQIFGDEA